VISSFSLLIWLINVSILLCDSNFGLYSNESETIESVVCRSNKGDGSYEFNLFLLLANNLYEIVIDSLS
jgi:hypothetical protein